MDAVDKRQPEDGKLMRYPQDWVRGRLMNHSEMEYGAQEATGKERTPESLDDMDYQIRAGRA